MNAYPDHLTQGHDLAELEEMLADVYQIRQKDEKRLAQKRKSGILKLQTKGLQPTVCRFLREAAKTAQGNSQTREGSTPSYFPLPCTQASAALY
ncbi:hypothetical protein AGMMS4952_13500 [Spirochaetia bacterium]|nr:hypothetical protein AGMMS4952_13500 [Spirochaetia bacterium]